jgi:uncharacterized membrane protein YraQ (UPF0718 family)
MIRPTFATVFTFKNKATMLFGIFNILFGALVWSPVFVASDKREKYAKALSWVGIVLLIWGIMGTVSSLLYIATFAEAPFYWTLWLSGGVTSLLLGLLLGTILIKRSSAGIVNKILPYQRIIGLIAIIIGVLQFFVTP